MKTYYFLLVACAIFLNVAGLWVIGPRMLAAQEPTFVMPPTFSPTLNSYIEKHCRVAIMGSGSVTYSQRPDGTITTGFIKCDLP